LLEVNDLRVAFHGEHGVVRAVDGVDFAINEGEVVAIVGESGSGKSALALSVMGLVGAAANAELSGSVRFEGMQLLDASEQRLRRIRGARMAMVFQDPMSALNPVRRVGDQIAEQIRAHEPLGRAQARERAVRALRRAGVGEPERRARSYPHELSGGLRQRAMIAMALSCSPRLLIADEPTTALDVTVQAQILAELVRLRQETGMAVLLITHDLGVVAGMADRVIVMYAGQIVEQGSARELFEDPQHPYTWGLMGSIARLDRSKPPRLAAIPGAPPSPLRLPSGCRFRDRCPHAFDRCAEPVELLARVARGATGHLDRCVLDVDRKRSLRVSVTGIGV
jgi:oligopeptide/dipeptide ABC transporter ATP-binding protein